MPPPNPTPPPRRARRCAEAFLPAAAPTWTTLLVLGALTPATGCGNVVDLPPASAPIPFVEGILVPGNAVAIRVAVLDPVTRQVEAVSADAVILHLRGPAGHTAVVPAGGPDLFTATVPVQPGGRYELSGTVAGNPVVAETVVPTTFTVAEPAGSSVPAPAGQTLVAEIPYRFHAAEAAAFLADSAIFDTGERSSRFAAGRIRLLARAPGSPPGPVIRFLALNRDASRYLLSAAPTTNVVGGFGVLGAALARQVVVTWPDQ